MEGEKKKERKGRKYGKKKDKRKEKDAFISVRYLVRIPFNK